MPKTPKDVRGGSAEMVSYSKVRQYLRRMGMAGRPKKYHTQEERREAARQRNRKHYYAHREAVRARQAAYKTKQAAIKAAQKETSAET
jgi:hypothetical protein